MPADAANTSVSFDGVNDYVNVGSAASLNLTSSFSIEAWIKPNALPANGSFASVLTKAESYSLQFNGPRLEFTIMQNGARRRLQDPASEQGHEALATELVEQRGPRDAREQLPHPRRGRCPPGARARRHQHGLLVGAEPGSRGPVRARRGGRRRSPLSAGGAGPRARPRRGP